MAVLPAVADGREDSRWGRCWRRPRLALPSVARCRRPIAGNAPDRFAFTPLRIQRQHGLRDEAARLAAAVLAFRRVRPDELPSGLFGETGWE